MRKPDAVEWMFRGALSSYVVALAIVSLVFPGVSNLWVTILLLVSGFFGLLADYAAYRREKKRSSAAEPEEST